jgi:hypothetical protein
MLDNEPVLPNESSINSAAISADRFLQSSSVAQLLSTLIIENCMF